MKCCFCQSENLKLAYQNKYHRKKPDHGPINFYICLVCGSGITLPPPSAESLEELYASFDGGMSKFTRAIRERNSLNEWHHQCVTRCISYNNNRYNKEDEFKWIDVGAGNGEIAKIMARKFPKSTGLAIDFHSRPELLSDCKNVQWLQLDLNDPNFHAVIPLGSFDMVLSITVLEHVINPFNFTKSLLKLLMPGGNLYLTVPDMSSTASKTLKRFWPYLIWGEHINMPSRGGMSILLNNLISDCDSLTKAIVKPVVLPYPITYYLDHFHLRFISRFISKSALLKINTGILEASVS
jgi:SAM-dependent methyltransferase